MSTRKFKAYRTLSLVALGGVMVTIFCLSAQDATDSAEVSGSVVSWLHQLLNIDLPDGTVRTIAHCCEYAALGFFMHNAARSFKPGFNPLISITLSFIYAVTDEIHQLFVPGRAFQIIDLVVDLAGIIAGTIFFMLLANIIKKKQSTDTAK